VKSSIVVMNRRPKICPLSPLFSISVLVCGVNTARGSPSTRGGMSSHWEKRNQQALSVAACRPRILGGRSGITFEICVSIRHSDHPWLESTKQSRFSSITLATAVHRTSATVPAPSHCACLSCYFGGQHRCRAEHARAEGILARARDSAAL